MRRIGLVLALGLTLAPPAAEPQQEKVHRVGVLLQASPRSGRRRGARSRLDRVIFSPVAERA
jgi:hypothetical protein